MSVPESEGSRGSFIVNLCAVPRPSIPEHLPVDLEGLRPFLSRRTKDGVHRFYLHVGFFRSRGEAEAWVRTARATYPNAFVSEISDAVRPSEPGGLPIADTHEMKVLEVRAPRHDDDVTDTPASWPLAVSPPPAGKAFDRADGPKAPKAPTDAWSEVVAEKGSNASVRHLRVEIQRPRDPSRKSPKPRK
jgi:hypothetical protein